MCKTRGSSRLSAYVMAMMACSVIGLDALAQDKKDEKSSTGVSSAALRVETVAQVPAATPPILLPAYGGLSGRNLGNGIVKDAPFSGELVSESVQILADGNRILNRSSMLSYRDSQGRTRQEMSFNILGSSGGANNVGKSVHIFDPVSGTSYTLDPQTHIARKFTVTPPANGQFFSAADKVAPFSALGRALRPTAPRPMVDGATQAEENNGMKIESLGKQMIERVEVEGTRITYTIPAGAMGNERQIETIHERWYSPALQMDVVTKWVDPRSGESEQRLINVTLSEPDPSLFQVPAGYTIHEVEAPVPPTMKRLWFTKPNER